MGQLPTFVIIGAMKCGTSALYGYLRAHPQVAMSTIKEPHFFIEGRNFDKGLDWYRSLWPTPARARGEATSSYTKTHAFPEVPGRMRSIIPEARLVYLVRDPLDRIVAHYIHNVAEGREVHGFAEAIERRPGRNNYLLTSSYARQLEAFRAHYPTDQILVVDSHDLRSHRIATLRTVFAHVGVRRWVRSEQFSKTSHSTEKKREQAGIERPQWNTDTLALATEMLRPEVEHLRAMTGLAFETWSL